ncbi:hypothetical protein [Geomicrobium sp. JCM 19039]|uniref:hypothetical protein n=1 Tax=Geomicrobium sp. JCM 19039 TaxID=1460636 RepID=UPI00045F1E19|nr:hypothetical protein [Geomicrobium sp. JCM 19039]GAK14646.1 hypothetical protein JCM19039_4583 [Geomicrobium sp. JCM 19039]
MFKGSNKWMWIIPGGLMIALFIGGYMYVTGADSIDHDELQEVVEIDAQIGDTTVDVHWDWGMLPEGELEGEEYVGITLFNNDGEQISGDQIDEASVTLFQSGNEVYARDGEIVDEGVILSFPNRLDTYNVYGVEGHAEVSVSEDIEEVTVYYLHTWETHAGQGGDDPTFEDPPFPGMDGFDHFYWVIEETF